MESQFIINNRFKVKEAVNTVTDLETGIETRLEPRLMKLIILLITHKSEVVTRQQIITDIWDDYGNADEGLNQAVSFLRKVFIDTDKQLIRTIPKKGYMLDAIVSTNMLAQPATSQRFSRRSTGLYIILAALAIITAAVIYFLMLYTPGGPVEPPGSIIDTTYKYRELKEAIDQQGLKDAETGK